MNFYFKKLSINHFFSCLLVMVFLKFFFLVGFCMENELVIEHLLALPPAQFQLVDIEILQESLHQSANRNRFFIQAAVLNDFDFLKSGVELIHKYNTYLHNPALAQTHGIHLVELRLRADILYNVLTQRFPDRNIPLVGAEMSNSSFNFWTWTIVSQVVFIIGKVVIEILKEFRFLYF